ncbi:hypothetical protein [Nannocystis sp. SCPEA4]|uniref:hypothetical protein n=1 Tax=Nannocystis sp. SCPEA4 TaxID=2996787 RepID=UPI0022715963|nr:hypothetical protein [Nannocystis sp. SCPEA4]MCY1053915.1 hypothetical protein [Nannocystis sp. SCPEA4]
MLVIGCAEPREDMSSEVPEEDPGRQPGDGCGDLPSECADAETLWECHERRWELVDCAQECSSRGGLVGCLTEPGLAGKGARCWCEDDTATCGPGQAECASDDVLQVCDPDTLEFEESSCEDVCGALDPPQLSRGCSFARCDCTLAGTPCEPDSRDRCEAFALARCVDGLWVVESCLCSPGECDPWAPGGPACDC